MKMMTMLMPLMSLYFAFILPGAIGIYWIFNNGITCGWGDHPHQRSAASRRPNRLPEACGPERRSAG